MNKTTYLAVSWPEYQEYLGHDDIYYCAEHDLYFIPEYIVNNPSFKDYDPNNIKEGAYCLVWDDKNPQSKSIKRFASPGYCYDSLDNNIKYPWDHIVPLDNMFSL